MTELHRHTAVAVTVLALVALAWLPYAFETATLQIDQSLENAAVVFGLSRALNGVISVLQSTEISLVFATLTVGEILDPLNDLIERFSDLMTVALASLALQKLFVELTSTPLFSVLLTIAGAAALITLKIKTIWHQSALGIFAITVFIRLSLTAVVILNGAVDSFITERFQQSQVAALEATKISLSDAQAATSSLTAEMKTQRARAQQLRAQIKTARTKKTELESKFDRLQGALKPCPIWKMTLGTCNEAEKRASGELERIKNNLGVLRKQLKSLENSLEETQERLTCLANKINGDSCGVWGSLVDKIPDPRAVIENAMAKSEAAVMAFLNLMAIFILKTIVSPLLFWWLFLVGIKAIYRRAL